MSVAAWLDDRRDKAAERLSDLRQGVAQQRTRRRSLRGATIDALPQREQLIWLGIDALAISALVALITVAWLPTFGMSWMLVASLGGGVLGLAVAAIAALRLWSPMQTAGVAVASYLIFGTALAMPSAGYFTVIPSLRSLAGLFIGPVAGWKGILTVAPPIGETDYLLVPVLVTSLTATIVASAVSTRSGRPTLAWIPLLVAELLAFAMGVSVSVAPAVVGVATVAVILIWTSYRRAQQRSALVVNRGSGIRVGRTVMGAVVLLVASAVTLTASGALTPTQARATLRSAVTRPLDIRQFPSPLQGFRLNLTDNLNEPLFQVDGLPGGTRVRVATMDSYDGYTYNVSNSTSGENQAGEFQRIGAKVVDNTRGTDFTAKVAIRGYDGVWVPTAGQLTSISFAGSRPVALADGFYYNQGSGTGLTVAKIDKDDGYRLTGIIPTQPTEEQILAAQAGEIELPPVEGAPDVVRDTAAKWLAFASGSSAGAIATAYTQQLQQGYFSHGVQPDETLSPPGHSAGRIQSLLRNTEQMVGDQEQYAVTLALLLRSAGLPARVGYGYVVPDGGQVTGANVTAWTEVYFQDYGWVVFEPTPPEDRKLEEVTQEPRTAPKPQVENPPPPPVKPENEKQDNSPPTTSVPPPDDPLQIPWEAVGTVAVVVGIPLIFVVLPIVLLIAVKMRRRRQRMSDPILVQRVVGGWSELVDRARDLGRSPSRGGTRTEQADQLVAAFPRVVETADPRILARQADMTVFSPDQITPGQAATYWTAVDGAVAGLNRSVGFFRRLRGTLSVRSFRRYR